MPRPGPGRPVPLDDVVSCLVHIVDLGQFAAFNASYGKQFRGPTKPVRTTVRADLVAGMLVEVTVIARKDTPGGTVR
jgi:enamine deaminase RidA (YjgF/YER057c/UK114 family)